MKRIYWTSCALFLLFSFSILSNTLKVGIDPYPPYIIVDNHITHGMDFLLVKEVARRAGLKVEEHPCPWKRCLTMMKLGEIDILSNLGRTKERESFIAYFNAPYDQSDKVVFYIKKGSKVKIERYEDLHRYQIGVRKGENHFPRFDQDKKINKYSLVKFIYGIKMLTQGRVDAVVNTEVTGDYILQKEGLKNKITKASFSEKAKSQEVYMGLSKKSKYYNQVNKFSNIQKDIIVDGTYQKFMNRYK